MKKKAQMPEVTSAQVHPLLKSYTFVSSKHVDYDNLTAIEAVSMTAVLVLAITVGVLQSVTLV